MGKFSTIRICNDLHFCAGLAYKMGKPGEKVGKLHRAFGFSRSKLRGTRGRQAGASCNWAALKVGKSTEWLVHHPGVWVDESGGRVLSIYNALLDCRFDETTFKVKDMVQPSIIETAALACDLLPATETNNMGDARAVVKALNEQFGEQFFSSQLFSQGRGPHIEKKRECAHAGFDAIVFRPGGRKKQGDVSMHCGHCLRKPVNQQELTTEFAQKKRFCSRVISKYCTVCLRRFRGDIPAAFVFTKSHFLKGRITKSLASKKLMRTGPDAITLTDMLASLFDTDIRDLVGYTYRPYIKNRQERIWCAMLCMAMPLGVFFCDETGGNAPRELRSKFSVLSAIFRKDPDRAVSLWNLEHHSAKFWASQDWKGLSAAGRMPVVCSDPKIAKMRKDPLIFKLDEKQTWGPSELLVWVDDQSFQLEKKSPETTLPFLMPRTTVAMLYLIFVERRVSVELVLESAIKPPTNTASTLKALDLTNPFTLTGNKLTLSNCELLSFDLLFWIINRPCILGKIDMLDIELRGNYARAVKNTNYQTYKYALGHTFVDLVDFAAKEEELPGEPLMRLSVDPDYMPSNECGEEERCAELELGALADKTWPPVLPFAKKSVKVAFGDMVNIVRAHAREFDTIWPSVCNSFAVGFLD